MDIPRPVWIILVLVASYAFYVMIIVPGQEVAGAAAGLVTTAADLGGDVLGIGGDVLKGATKAGAAVAGAVTKECRDGFQKVGLDCLVKCPDGTSGLYCKRNEYKLDTYKVSKTKHSCRSGYKKKKWPNNKTCIETSCRSGYTRKKWPNDNTCKSACPQYTEEDWTGGCKRKPERHWF